MANAYLNYNLEQTLEALLVKYKKMNDRVKEFEQMLEEHKMTLSDNITKKADQLLSEIKEEMRQIEKYILLFTSQKLTGVREIKRIEEYFGKVVEKA